MTVPKEEIEARDLVDAWIGKHNIQIDTDGAEYWQLVEKVQEVVKERDLQKKHADEGWKLANTRTTERQEILVALKSLLDVMDMNLPTAVSRESAKAVVEKFKPLLEG